MIENVCDWREGCIESHPTFQEIGIFDPAVLKDALRELKREVGKGPVRLAVVTHPDGHLVPALQPLKTENTRRWLLAAPEVLDE